VSHLLSSIFKMHDRHLFEVFVYSLSGDDKSSWRQKCVDEVEHFQDISLLQADDAATLIHSDGIHVLFNLNGYTKGGRSEIFSLRPAPIAINFLGYNGTTGADYIDYIVGDDVVIPEEVSERSEASQQHINSNTTQHTSCPCELNCYLCLHDVAHPSTIELTLSTILARSFHLCSAQHSDNYSEHLISMPSSFVVNDMRNIAPYMLDDELEQEAKRTFNRSYYGISDDVFVYACFNQLYKITPEVFKVWCEVLLARDNTVLWLLKFPEIGAENLYAEAEKHGVGRERIVFSEVAEKKEHIIRCNLADLVLDTTHCGMTTSTEVLWSGTPMISVLGGGMSERIGGSLLKGCGLDELVCKSLEEYKDKAIQLANEPEKLMEHRRKLEGGRESCDLFNTKKWIKGQEERISTAVHNYEKGHKLHDLK